MQALIRIDKWLWAARFYKTRSMATEAVEGGRVHVNKQRVKPSYRVKIDDRVSINKAGQRQDVIVLEVSDKRTAAKIAQTLYSETEESRERRDLDRLQRKIFNQGLPQFDARPDKHARRKILSMKGKS
jgi:ribosome-associated heat shock protein Hsp15